MPRKGHIAKREPLADPVYQSTLVNKFVNSMMWDGKKSTAQGIFYNAMKKLEDKGGDEAMKLFKKAVENVQAGAGSEDPPRGRRQLPGAGRGQCRPPHLAGHPLAD